MNAKDVDETLAVIVKRAKELRDAGVVGKVALDRIEFELAGPELEPPMVPLQQSAPDEPNPLDDAATFGTDEVPKRRKSLGHDEARAEFERD